MPPQFSYGKSKQLTCKSCNKRIAITKTEKEVEKKLKFVNDAQDIFNVSTPKRNTLPDEFPLSPPDPGAFTGKSDVEYKEYMLKRHALLEWEDNLTLYRIKEAQGNDEACKQIIIRLKNNMLKTAVSARRFTMEISQVDLIDVAKKPVRKNNNEQQITEIPQATKTISAKVQLQKIVVEERQLNDWERWTVGQLSDAMQSGTDLSQVEEADFGMYEYEDV